jgi:hypothetical protein
MGAALQGRIAVALSREVRAEVRAFAGRLAAASGALAVLFYGSNLRTGSLDGVLDYYVLLPGPHESGIWPRVSYHEWSHGGTDLRAKVATMTLGTFAAAAHGELLDTTIWARFVQPSALVWQRSDEGAIEVERAVAAAAVTAARLAAALGPERGTASDFWRALFQATYRAEFRVEKSGREDSILSFNLSHFDGLLPLALDAGGIGCKVFDDGTIEPVLSPAQRKRTLGWWRKRRRLGKPLNLVRLVRASTTFEGAARYGAWKIERHTGIAVQLTPWRERHPVLAAPRVLWQVWRARRSGATKAA